VRGDLALLRAASLLEFVSLVVLLGNLATVHERAVSSGVGPVHGCAYVFVVIAVFREGRAATGTRVLALLPGVGGVLALRRPASDR
jgi:hypothetical protein